LKRIFQGRAGKKFQRRAFNSNRGRDPAGTTLTDIRNDNAS
jgi:hypothetical protein